MKYFRLSTGGFDFYENISKNIIIVHSPSSTIDGKIVPYRVVARFRLPHLNQTWFLKFIRLTFGHINTTLIQPLRINCAISQNCTFIFDGSLLVPM